jgi:hypothetical protein
MLGYNPNIVLGSEPNKPTTNQVSPVGATSTMTKGPYPHTPRIDRPTLTPDGLPWLEQPTGPGHEASPCGRERNALAELVEPLTGPVNVVAGPAGGRVRLVSGGKVRAVLSVEEAAEIVRCMSDGWRYSGVLSPLDERTGSVTLEGRRLL